MFLNQKRLIYFFLANLSFILGCTLTLFFLHTTTFKSITLPKEPRFKLLVLVISAVKNQNRRDAIRETWAQAKDDVEVRFVSSQDKFLNAEKLVHNDILEVDVTDEYRLLSLKLLKAFDNVRSLNFEYLLKCDDDSFVDIPKIINELNFAPKNKFYWGYFDGNAHIKRAGKWKETDWILCDKYLPYALGGGYVLSKDLVMYIVNNQDYLR
jgi:galactosylxylosylprotein 3-beta-galactosyltransferase